MDKKHDHMSEALMRRRHEFAKKAPAPAHQEMAAAAENKKNAEVAPEGANPQGMAAGADPDGDAMVLTPEKLMELLGSSNAPGLRGAVMQHAAGMAKKC